MTRTLNNEYPETAVPTQSSALIQLGDAEVLRQEAFALLVS
jgi:hypothetical protein